MVVPPHPPLTPPPPPFETPEDTTAFVELDSDEAELQRTDAVKVNLALRGKVGPDPYPFCFSSGTFSLGSFFRSYRPCRYIGIGIHRDHIAVYEHVLACRRLVAGFNDTAVAAAALTARLPPEKFKTDLRKLTGRVLSHIVELRRLSAAEAAAAIGDFPLTAHSEFFRLLLFGLWEELWAVAFQTAADEVAYGRSALMTAATALWYYRRAAEVEGTRLDCVATAQARVAAVAVGFITSRSADAQRQRRTGDIEIPWHREPAHAGLPGFKYSALCLVSLAPFLARTPPKPPAPRYEAAFRAAALYAGNAYGMTGAPASTAVDAGVLLDRMAESWSETGEAGKLGRVPHPGCTAAELWREPEIPARIAHLAAEAVPPA